MNGAALFIETEWASRIKHGQSICGDAVVAQKCHDQQRHVIVVSDGLGSGVKASILSTMTATMAARFIQANCVTPQALNVMMDALPVCKTRQISYATFTIIDTSMNGRTRIIEMGNPSILHIRNNEMQPYEYSRITTSGRPDRDIRMSRLNLQPGDRLVCFSDGITQAGLGTENLKLGWRRKGCADFVIEKLTQHPELSARELAGRILKKALSFEPDNKAHDDMTCVVMYYRRPRKLLLMTGPPFRESHDPVWARTLITYPGKRIVCGGTTANILERELRLKSTTSLRSAGGLPAASKMNGTNLVTEGILTLTRVCQLLESGQTDESPATAIIELFKNHDIIDLYVGTKINEAHQDPNLPADLDIRRNIIKRIAATLEQKYLKEVNIQYV